ncbi:hypothetical protein HOLleu_20032 [Holothuria leucospilota]|uniref:Uncharacterized protein n=1 Tax=Holothuria leucospilota TaxID=206669 RepID=A0A9Q1H5E7_HOLLE|nr:hypothetical protein HOLleu_20032 [Holothuria leucospilota]
MGNDHTPGDDSSSSDLLGSGDMDRWDSSDSSDTDSDGDSDADSVNSHRNLRTETTCAEDGSGLEGMGDKSDGAVTLNTTGLPSFDADKTARLV